MTRKSKAQRQEWWASLTPAEQAGYIDRVKERKAANPTPVAQEASARLALARERRCFMRDVPDEDVAERLRGR